MIPLPPLQQKLFGKALLPSELLDYDLSHYDHQIGYTPALERKDNVTTCNRCGTTNPSHFYTHHCARCGKQCEYCRNCIMMGKMQSCAKLITWTGLSVEFPTTDQALNWDGSLSPGQQTASDRVVQAILNKEEYLVWAVCGAGKTEVLFHGIAVSLQKGERVCIATPRTDVVLELAPRLEKAFPDTVIAALYGGSEDKDVCAQLVISTTHQLLRYKQAFDTVIIDEVDAFPYSMDASLKYATKQSRKLSSSLIYLTATPSAQMIKAANNKQLPHVTIPARFHRRPIPVPRMQWAGNWQKAFAKKKIPAPLKIWYLNKLETKTPFLIFFPNIEKMKEYLPLFQQEYEKITAVYAEDPERKGKVASLRNGERLGLLTTTILERGVTIPGLHVAVIGAEEDIFTESALVQIAGRVGRSKDDPIGDIIFFHYGKSAAMVKAVKQIHYMNRTAKERGLIDA